MNEKRNPQENSDPFAVLGLPPGADQERVRKRYLELVKQHPPERDPDKFRELQQAYEAARDPMVIARLLIAPQHEEEPRPWAEIIDEHRRRPPRLDPDLLLSLGNRTAANETSQANDNAT